jgi:hypothetical protein
MKMVVAADMFLLPPVSGGGLRHPVVPRKGKK